MLFFFLPRLTDSPQTMKFMFPFHSSKFRVVGWASYVKICSLEHLPEFWKHTCFSSHRSILGSSQEPKQLCCVQDAFLLSWENFASATVLYWSFVNLMAWRVLQMFLLFRDPIFLYPVASSTAHLRFMREQSFPFPWWWDPPKDFPVATEHVLLRRVTMLHRFLGRVLGILCSKMGLRQGVS